MKIMTLILTLSLVGCVSTPSHRNYTDTMALIKAAADVAPRAVQGVYKFEIKASGSQRQWVYLNTELDYRDQRNITVALTPKVAAELAEAYGEPAEDFFLNKSIEVNSYARRVKILFNTQKPNGKYYYQTHVPVKDTWQIKILP